MAARAIWKGSISFGSTNIPVKLYSAVEDRGIHFNLLDRKTRKPVKQQMVNPETGEVVEYGDTRRAYEMDNGDLVILEKDDLTGVAPEPTRDIEVLHFLKPEQITHQWYDRPYYLGPDESSKGYFALAAALKAEKKEGLARWVMRGKEYFGALVAEGDYLMLITLRHADEVVTAGSLSAPGGRELSKAEIAMARQLIETMEGDLDLGAYCDEYRDRVMEFIKAKGSGKVVRLPKARAKKTTDDLAAILKRSLVAADKERASA